MLAIELYVRPDTRTRTQNGVLYNVMKKAKEDPGGGAQEARVAPESSRPRTYVVEKLSSSSWPAAHRRTRPLCPSSAAPERRDVRPARHHEILGRYF